MTRILLGLGSNLGDRAASLSEAIAAIGRFATVERVSSVYETAPMYVTDQARFLNIALTAETSLAPGELLDALKGLETELGRIEGVRFGPRRIDMDILLYGETMHRSERLEIPHPRMAERAFVLVPAAEIAGDWRHPPTGLTITELLRRLGPLAGVERRTDIPLGSRD